MEQQVTHNILAFLSSHGFGHASRTSAVIEELARSLPHGHHINFHLATQTPRWFFKSSLSVPFHYHQVETDVGLIQQNPLLEDLEATAQALNSFYPLSDQQLERVVDFLPAEHTFDAVVCDIAPMGILLAEQWEIPSILIENFTWPWIYRSYPNPPAQLPETADYLASIYDHVDLHIQCDPMCDPSDSQTAHRVSPIARSPHFSKQQMRNKLDIDEEATLILATMGGIPDQYDCVDQLQSLPYSFILAGSFTEEKRIGNCLLLPHRSDYYHPDLVHTSDMVVGKLGYSTLAEVVNSKKGFIYLTRPHFPESNELQKYVEENLAAYHLSPVDFYNGKWGQAIEEVLDLQSTNSVQTPAANGAKESARLILDVIQ